MIRKSKSIVIIALSCLISVGFLFQSCEKEDFFDMEEAFITTGEKKTERISINDHDVLNLKERLEKSSKVDGSSQIAKEVNNNNLRWDLAYKVTQGSMKGIFVPLKSSTEADFKVLASLFVGGQMKEYILQKKATASKSKFTGEVNFYRSNGKQFRQDVYKKGKLTSKPSFNTIRLKSSPCETDDGTGTIDDYNSWFDADCDSQRFANNTNDTIWYKPEHDSTSIALAPGQWTDNEIDGYSQNGTVHKVTGGYNTGACTNSGFQADYGSFYYGYYLFVGGDKDDDWLEERHEDTSDDPNGDHGWDSLFGK
jgi:hypothetical protein